jgi:hypothetical protein
MSIDLRNESTISLSQAARMLPPGRRGRPVTLSCVLRWVLDGVRTPAGIVRLEAIRLGGRWLTSIEAIERFADRQTPEFDRKLSPPPRSCNRAAERAGKQLENLGI